MKTSKDPRHKRRITILEQLFAESFTDQAKVDPEAKEIWAKRGDLDRKIEKAAPTWPIDKINKIDLAILRLAIHELENSSTPPKVAIDEAVELAKEFGSDNSASFVNGVLGTIYNETGVKK